jgi:hypothetical protein
MHRLIESHAGSIVAAKRMNIPAPTLSNLLVVRNRVISIPEYRLANMQSQ